MAQCEHQDDEGMLCNTPATFDVVNRARIDAHGYSAEWMACEQHARECKADGCDVEGLEEDEEKAFEPRCEHSSRDDGHCDASALYEADEDEHGMRTKYLCAEHGHEGLPPVNQDPRWPWRH